MVRYATDCNGAIFTAMCEGEFDLLERYILERLDGQKIDPIPASFPIIAVWLGREHIGVSLSRLQIGVRSVETIKNLLSALFQAFIAKATHVFTDLLNPLLKIEDGHRHGIGLLTELRELRLDMAKTAASDNVDPAFEEMLQAYDTLLASAGLQTNGWSTSRINN